MLNKYKRIVYSFEDYENLAENCFRLLFFEENENTDLIFKYWNNMKIKIILDQSILDKSNKNNDSSLIKLVIHFIKSKNIKEIAQVLGVFCTQKNLI